MSPQGAALAAHINAIRQIRVAAYEHSAPKWRTPFVCVDCGNLFRSVLARPCCPRCESDDVRID